MDSLGEPGLTDEHRFLARIPEPLFEQMRATAETTGASINSVAVNWLTFASSTASNAGASWGASATYYTVNASNTGGFTLAPEALDSR